MIKTISPRLTMLCVGLAMLLSAACKKAPDKSVMGGAASTSPASSASQPAPGSSTVTPGSTAAPGGQAPASTPAGSLGKPSSVAGLAGAPGSAAPAEQPLPPEKLPAVVARVNGKAVKRQELIQGAEVMQMQLAQHGQRVVPSSAFYRRVLDDLIAFTLIQQDAKAQGVTASPTEVQQQIDARKHSFPSEGAYREALAKAGMTEAVLREEADNQIVVQKFLETQVASKVTVSDQAARQFYDKNKSSMTAPERVHLRHIVVQVAQNASPADKAKAKQKADEIYKKVQGGEDFAKAATQYSDDPASKGRGGDIGWIVKGQTLPQFEAAAFALKKPNDLAPPVETRSGYSVLQLVERQAAGEIPFDQVKPRLVALLKQQQVQKILQARAEELRAKAKVEVFI
ncbi:MAG TPA: peptidylprolyl isomerase [Thermoanaerobaculia bacterium]